MRVACIPVASRRGEETQICRPPRRETVSRRETKEEQMNIDPLPQRAPYEVSPRQYSVSHQMVTTAFELPNFRVTQTLGVVRGIVVRSRNVFATLGAAVQQVVGGNITIWTKMCEETRSDAFDIMIQHASEIGANAVIGARY